MPTFGDFETIGEPIAVAEQSGHVSTVWRAHKSGSDSSPTHAIKVFAPHRRKTKEGEPEEALDKDRGLEFLEGVKQLKKAQAEEGRYLSPIYAFGFADEGAWYVTDFYPRNTLKAWIARRGSVDGAALRQVVYCIVAGCLALKRSRGYSHANLKAANVFLVGKPQPLRKTPLALADSFPSAPLQLGQLADEEKRTVDDLLHQVVEVQDLRALGELLLQLVEGRLVSSAYDYNYPVAASPAWERLGRDAERWRNLTNQLLDPRLSLEKTNLESLAKEFRPSGITPHLPKIFAGAGAVCVIVVGIYVGLQMVERGRERRQKANEIKFVALMNDSKSALDRNEFSIALQKVEEALRLKPNSADATNLKTQAGQKIEAAYQNEFKAAQGALTEGAFDEAERLAGLALQIKKDDPSASSLMKEAQTRRNARLTQADQDRNYTNAVSAAQTALAQSDFARAISEADRALGFRRDNEVASKLKTDAQAAQQKALEQAQQNRNYTNAVNAAQAAYQRNDFSNTVVQADVALNLRSGDPTATKLKTDAQAAQQNALAQAQQNRNYTNAVEAAQAALAQSDFAKAISEADQALDIRRNDTTATKLKTDAQAAHQKALAQAQQNRNYTNAVDAAQAAFQRNDFSNTVVQADVALSLRSGDTTATRLKTDAQAAQQKALAQAQQNRNYSNAVDAAQAAFQRNDFSNTVVQADVALNLRSGDTTATRLKTDAQAAQQKVLAQAQQNRNYSNAVDAAQAAFQRNDFSNTVVQADVALNLRSGDTTATRLKTEAQAAQQNAVAQAQRDRNYTNAVNAAQAAYQRNDFSNTVVQADVALNLRSGDPIATRLKTDAEAGMEAQEKTARQARYQAAMVAATNEMTQAQAALAAGANNATQYEVALTHVSNALIQCAIARTNGDVAVVNGLAGQLSGLQNQVQQRKDFDSASRFFANGQYGDALNLCAKYNTPEFAELAAKVNREKSVYDTATIDYEKGVYGYLQNPSVIEYQQRQTFKKLMEAGSAENGMLNELSALKSATNWTGFLNRWNDLGRAAYLSKPPFRGLYDWASQEQSNEARKNQLLLEGLDTKIEIYRVRFNLLSARKAKSKEAQQASVYGEIASSFKNQILTELKGYRRQFEIRRSLTDDRKRILDELEKKIPDYYP